MKNGPNFLVVGVPKAGTSSLYNYLKQHPDIFLPEQKELHFFTHQELAKNISGPGDKLALSSVITSEKDYLAKFKAVSNQKAIGEISPSYFYLCRQTIPKIKNALGENTKIIILLRDPVDRAFSNFLHQKRLLYENLSFAEAIETEPKRRGFGYSNFWLYSEHSLYYDNCKYFLDEFGSENVKIILFEDLKSDTKKTIGLLCEFLNVNANFDFNNLDKVHNQGGVYKENSMTKFLLKPSRFKNAIQSLVNENSRKRYKALKAKILNSSNIEKPKIEDSTLIKLREKFSPDAEKLKEFNIDVSKWHRLKN